jgi:hypothetical protein
MTTEVAPGRLRVDLLWPTFICVRTLTFRDGLVQDAARGSSPRGAGDEAEDRAGLDSVEHEALASAAQLGASEGHRYRPSVVGRNVLQLEAGSYVTCKAASTRHVALYWLEAVRSSEGYVGDVVLLDPRAGAANVPSPGLPLGRPQVLRPMRGMLLVIPGWLGYSIAPVRQGSGQKVAELLLD